MNKELNRGLLLRSVLTSLIGFMLLEVLMIALSKLHPGGELSWFAIVFIGVLGALVGSAACISILRDDEKITVFCWQSRHRRIALDCYQPVAVLGTLVTIMIAMMLCAFFIFHADFAIVSASNECIAVVYGCERSCQVMHIWRLIRDSEKSSK